MYSYREKMLHFLKRTRFEIVLLLVASSLIFIGLGGSSLLDYDEAIYAQVAREMVKSNDWLTLNFGGAPWFEKPPLYIWSTAILLKIFGMNEFWARAASAISAVFVIISTYFLGSRIFNRWVGALTVLPLLTGYEFLRQARNGTTDLMLTLFMMLTLFAYVRMIDEKSKPGASYLFWIAFALGFMVKFWAAAIVLVAVGLSIVVERKVRATLTNKHFWGGLFVALVLIAPWHLAMLILHKQAFIDRYVIFDLIARSTRPLEGNIGAPRYYLDRMLFDYSPWFLLLPVALTLEFKRVTEKRDETSVLLVFVASIFGIYSLLIDTKIFHYLTPIYPILAILISNVIVQAFRAPGSIAFSGLLIASLISLIIPSAKVLSLFLLLVGLSVLALYLGRRLFSRRDFEKGKGEIFKSTSRVGPVIGQLNQILSQLKVFTNKNNLSRLAVLYMLAFLTLIGILRSRPLYVVHESEVEQIARFSGSSKVLQKETIIALALPPDYQYAIVGPAAMFYSDRPIEVAWTEEALAQYTSGGPREIIMAQKFLDVLEPVYDFSGLASNSTFVYGVIQKKNNP